jgi:type IV pilus assembly protein PilB
MMGITAKEQAAMWRAFASRLKSGAVFTEALAGAAKESTSDELSSIVAGLVEAANAGTDLSVAMEKHPKVFPGTVRMMMRAGEKGGVVDVVAERVARGLENGAFPVPNPAEPVTDDLARILRALAILTSSGVPIVSSFDLIDEDIPEGRMRAAMQAARTAVSNGETISVAFRRMPKLIDTRVVDAITVGEQSGNLDESLHGIADALEQGDVSKLPRPAAPTGSPGDVAGNSEQPPVVKYVNLILLEAIREGASDIHIDQTEGDVSVRYRVAGVLHRKASPPRTMARAIVSRLKIMASLDVAECRKPQDGKMQLKIQGSDYDIRVSTLPAVYGESLVLRILPQSNAIRSLDSLGLSDDKLSVLKDLVRKPNGLVLVSGPAGSGKTTLLHSLINEINREDNCVVSVEDPVMIRIPGLRQVQINRRQGLTPASALRSIMRQDPDVVFISDIYESEVAQLAVNAAATGHLVFAQLHAQNATTAIQLMLDLGVERYRLGGTLAASISQRLVRKLCEKCRREVEIDGSGFTPEAAAFVRERATKVYAPGSCDACANGYKGRVPIHEIMTATPAFRRALTTDATAEEIRQALIDGGMKTMLTDALSMAVDGVTSVEEAWRVAFDGA